MNAGFAAAYLALIGGLLLSLWTRPDRPVQWTTPLLLVVAGLAGIRDTTAQAPFAFFVAIVLSLLATGLAAPTAAVSFADDGKP